MAYRSVTHVAIRVEGLPEAERYYGRLFGLEVAFREAKTVDGWRTLPEDAGWEDAEAAGISLSMCVLFRDAFRLALEEDPTVDTHGVLDHVGLLVEPEDLEALRAQAGELDAMIALQRDTLLILDDRYGVRWEITTSVREDPRSESSGAARGLWLDLGGGRPDSARPFRVASPGSSIVTGRPLSEWALRAAEDSGAIELIAMALPVAALTRLAVEDPEGARDLLADLGDRPQVRQNTYFSPFLPDAVRSPAALTDLAVAGGLTSGIEPFYPYQEHALVSARAILAEARGETKEAVSLYQDAAERWGRFGVVPERAFALLGQGRCLLALGDAAAGEALRQARDIFTAVGATPVLEEADALLERATASRLDSRGFS